MLIARGQLDAYSPVAQYWPEFAQRGKEAIEVRPLEVSDTYDWESSTSRRVIAG